MKNILAKLNLIQSEVGRMSKDGKNTAQHYNYLSETQVTEKMNDLFVKHKVVFTHTSIIKNLLPFKSKAGSQQFLTSVEVKYCFFDVESGEKIRGVVCGQGTDSGDKGVYKAVTGAIKYLFMKNFLIPTGDDPEADSVQAPVATNYAPAPSRGGFAGIGR